MTAAGQTQPEDKNMLSNVRKSPAWMASQSALKEKLISLSTVSEWEEVERDVWLVPALP